MIGLEIRRRRQTLISSLAAFDDFRLRKLQGHGICSYLLSLYRTIYHIDSG